MELLINIAFALVIITGAVTIISLFVFFTYLLWSAILDVRRSGKRLDAMHAENEQHRAEVKAEIKKARDHRK